MKLALLCIPGGYQLTCNSSLRYSVLNLCCQVWEQLNSVPGVGLGIETHSVYFCPFLATWAHFPPTLNTLPCTSLEMDLDRGFPCLISMCQQCMNFKLNSIFKKRKEKERNLR